MLRNLSGAKPSILKGSTCAIGIPLLLFSTFSAVLGPLSGAGAADLFGDDVASLLRTETVAFEASAGYLSGTAHEFVYRVPGDGSKLSQLNWEMNRAAVAGGRVVVQPFDRIAVRAKGWATLAAENTLNDYDWLLGFRGFDSWTHWSTHPNTETTKAFQGDVSIAAAFWREQDFALTAIAGYRYMTMKWNAAGGSYVYSTHALRDTTGNFPDRVGIAYQQWWQTPYVGAGINFAMEDLTLTGEVIGSVWSQGRDKDYHALRNVLFEENFSPAKMVGAAAGVEYRFSPVWSAVGRVEYERYFEAKGSTRILNGVTGTTTFVPKPGAGADNETILVSLGIKARL